MDLTFVLLSVLALLNLLAAPSSPAFGSILLKMTVPNQATYPLAFQTPASASSGVVVPSFDGSVLHTQSQPQSLSSVSPPSPVSFNSPIVSPEGGNAMLEGEDRPASPTPEEREARRKAKGKMRAIDPPMEEDSIPENNWPRNAFFPEDEEAAAALSNLSAVAQAPFASTSVTPTSCGTAPQPPQPVSLPTGSPTDALSPSRAHSREIKRLPKSKTGPVTIVPLSSPPQSLDAGAVQNDDDLLASDLEQQLANLANPQSPALFDEERRATDEQSTQVILEDYRSKRNEAQRSRNPPLGPPTSNIFAPPVTLNNGPEQHAIQPAAGLTPSQNSIPGSPADSPAMQVESAEIPLPSVAPTLRVASIKLGDAPFAAIKSFPQPTQDDYKKLAANAPANKSTPPRHGNATSQIPRVPPAKAMDIDRGSPARSLATTSTPIRPSMASSPATTRQQTSSGTVTSPADPSRTSRVASNVSHNSAGSRSGMKPASNRSPAGSGKHTVQQKPGLSVKEVEEPDSEGEDEGAADDLIAEMKARIRARDARRMNTDSVSPASPSASATSSTSPHPMQPAAQIAGPSASPSYSRDSPPRAVNGMASDSQRGIKAVSGQPDKMSNPRAGSASPLVPGASEGATKTTNKETKGNKSISSLDAGPSTATALLKIEIWTHTMAYSKRHEGAARAINNNHTTTVTDSAALSSAAKIPILDHATSQSQATGLQADQEPVQDSPMDEGITSEPASTGGRPKPASSAPSAAIGDVSSSKAGDITFVDQAVDPPKVVPPPQQVGQDRAMLMTSVEDVTMDLGALGKQASPPDAVNIVAPSLPSFHCLKDPASEGRDIPGTFPTAMEEDTSTAFYATKPKSLDAWSRRQVMYSFWNYFHGKAHLLAAGFVPNFPTYLDEDSQMLSAEDAYFVEKFCHVRDPNALESATLHRMPTSDVDSLMQSVAEESLYDSPLYDGLIEGLVTDFAALSVIDDGAMDTPTYMDTDEDITMSECPSSDNNCSRTNMAASAKGHGIPQSTEGTAEAADVPMDLDEAEAPPPVPTTPINLGAEEQALAPPVTPVVGASSRDDPQNISTANTPEETKPIEVRPPSEAVRRRRVVISTPPQPPFRPRPRGMAEGPRGTKYRVVALDMEPPTEAAPPQDHSDVVTSRKTLSLVEEKTSQPRIHHKESRPHSQVHLEDASTSKAMGQSLTELSKVSESQVSVKPHRVCPLPPPIYTPVLGLFRRLAVALGA
ncbi:hypothetical protein CVT26_005752 [Gymnopilus dilepis]|uniref:Uncharacterized protein n=1 Tax=Gymnopilus dilepis TaxID=231916 RepID=A0A409VPR3_9AGAR|nr:hypothetical protein CVT26_005752 [Gymnopilus dilepis]